MNIKHMVLHEFNSATYLWYLYRPFIFKWYFQNRFLPLSLARFAMFLHLHFSPKYVNDFKQLKGCMKYFIAFHKIKLFSDLHRLIIFNPNSLAKNTLFLAVFLNTQSNYIHNFSILLETMQAFSGKFLLRL